MHAYPSRPALYPSYAATAAAAIAAPKATAQPCPPIPDYLDTAICATAAAMPDQGDDPATHLAIVCDAFREFNPLDQMETDLVAQHVALAATFLTLLRRTTDPDLPATHLDRLIRTALAITRTRERIFRLLRPENGVSLLAQPEMWDHWKQTLIQREASRAAARAAAEAAKAKEAAEETEQTAPESASQHPMQSGKPRRAGAGSAAKPEREGPDLAQPDLGAEETAGRAGWLKEYDEDLAEYQMFQRQIDEDLAAKAAAKAARANAETAPLAP